MTYNQWESEFKKYLKSLPEKEKNEIIDYYREMYGDKRESGISDEEIIEAFGSPATCASKILTENTSEETEVKEENDIPKKNEALEKFVAFCRSTPKKINAASLVGWFFLITLFLIPLAAVLVSALASLGACVIVGGAVAISGVILAISSPVSLFIGYSALSALATFGAALVAIGLGIVIFEAFFILTKYFAFVSIKLCRYFFRRRVK